jgi:autotransporter-associated beta strand protein
MIAPNAHANSDSWVGAGNSANWSEDANWLYNRTGSDPVIGVGAPVANDNLIFTSPTTNNFTTLNNDLPIATLPSITFDVSAGPYVLNGSALTLNSASNNAIQNNSTATETIGIPLTINGKRTIAAINGPIVLTSPLGGTTGGEIFLGPFSTTLLAPATYVQPSSVNTSGTQIQSGTLIIGTGGSLPSQSAGGTYRTNSVALGTTAGLTGVLQLGDANGAIAQSINNLSVASATTSFNSDLVIGGSTNISTLTIDNTAAASTGSPIQAGNTTFTGILGGAGTNQNNLALTVNMLAANNVTLQNSNTYIGNTNVTGGALAIGSSTVPGSIVSPNVSVASGATFTVSQVGAISPSTNLTTNGTVNIRNAATTIKSINGSGSLALSTSTITTTLTITNGGNYSGNISSDPASGGNLAVSGGNLSLSGSNGYTGTTTVSSGALSLVGPNAWAPALNGPGNTILGGGKLVLDYGGNSTNDPVNTVKGILNSTAYAANFATGQIRTTSADALHGIGWKDDTNAQKLTVALTYYGDATVDGRVDTSDFTALAANFGIASGAVWAQGDFNYDGAVNALDFNMLASNFGATAAPALGTLVPEPTGIGALALLSLTLRRRRA